MYHSFKTFKSSVGSSSTSSSSSGSNTAGSSGSGGFYAGNDPFCPLGFHPQVRWPSRCKRCFRDYKDHEARKSTSDSRNNNLTNETTTTTTTSSSLATSSQEKKTSWSSRRTHSLDYTNSETDDNNELKINCKPNETKLSDDDDDDDGDENEQKNEQKSEFAKSIPTSWISTPDLSKLSDDCKPNETIAAATTASSIPTVNFTLPIRRSKFDQFTKRTIYARVFRRQNNKISISTTNLSNRTLTNGNSTTISSRGETLRKIRNENDELKNRFENLTQKYEELEREKDEILAKYFDVCSSSSSSAANDSTKSLQKFSNEILLNLQENCKTYRSQTDDLSRSKQVLEIRCARLEQQLQFERNHEALRNQLQATETLCEELLGENHDIKKEIKDLEDELDEMQDSFCDDFHSDEFHNLRKDLEQSNKNCRILSFKLRKAEKQKDLLETKKSELEHKIDSISDAKSILMQADRIREQEEQLNLSNQLIIQLQNDILLLNSKLLDLTSSSSSKMTAAAAAMTTITESGRTTVAGSVQSMETDRTAAAAASAAGTSKHPKLESIGRISSADGIKVSRESLIRSNSQEDPIQLYRDLQDSIEREFDFKEQLKYSEEESQYLRKKLTRLEDENESLMLQLKKMCSKSSSSSSSLSYSKMANGHETSAVSSSSPMSDTTIDFENADDENSSNTELKVLLDLNEQECSSLRKKVAEYESEIDILRSKLKEFEEKINKKKSKLKKSLFENNDSSLSNDFDATKKLKRKSLIKSRSLDTDEQTIDYKCQLKAVEQEVSVLRTKIQTLENENDKLITERNKLQSICNRKKSSKSMTTTTSSDKIKSLSDQLEKLESEKLDLERKLQMFIENSNTPSIRNLLDRSAKNLNDLQTKSQLKKHIQELESEIMDFVVVLQKVDNRNKCLETDLQSCKNTNDFENQIENLNCDLMEKNNQIKKLQDLNKLQTSELQGKLVNCEKRLEESQKSEFEAKMKLDSLQTKLEKLENECLLIKSRDNYDLENQIERLKEKLLKFERSDKELKNVQLEYEQKIREIQSIKKELDHYTNQCGNLKKDNDDLKLKLNDFNKLMAIQSRTNEQTMQMQNEIVKLQTELNESDRSRNQMQKDLSEKYENQTNILTNEIKLLETQIERIKKEKTVFKDTLDSVQKSFASGGSGGGGVDANFKGDMSETSKMKIKNYEDQIYNLENELYESKEEFSKLQMTLLNERSANDLQLSQLKSKLNELDEDRILTSGRTKLIGLKTRLELSWQKERNEQQRLLQENATLARDLRQTLFEIERERDKERLENRRKLDQMKKISERESDESQTRTVQLQQTLTDVRDSQAKLRAQNEKLRYDLDRLDQLKSIETRFIRSIHSLFDKLIRLFQQIPEFNNLLNLQPQQLQQYHGSTTSSKTDLKDFGGIPIAPPKRRKASQNHLTRDEQSLNSSLLRSSLSISSGNDIVTKSDQTSSLTLAKDICRLVDDLRVQLQTKIALVTTMTTTSTTAIVANGNRPKLQKKSTSLDHPSYALSSHHNHNHFPHSSLALITSNNSFKNFFVNNYHSSVQSLQNFGGNSPNYSLIDDGAVSHDASLSLSSINVDDQQQQLFNRQLSSIDSIVDGPMMMTAKTKTKTLSTTTSSRLSNDSIQSEIMYGGGGGGSEVRKKKSIFGRFKKLTKSKSVDHNDFKGDGMDFKDKFATMIRKAR